jgi:hypothetical protein
MAKPKACSSKFSISWIIFLHKRLKYVSVIAVFEFQFQCLLENFILMIFI